jgi:hypothetical protein
VEGKSSESCLGASTVSVEGSEIHTAVSTKMACLLDCCAV